MILGKLAHAAATGKITLHREPRHDDQEPPYKTGRDYAIQSRTSREALCRVTVTACDPATAGDLTYDQARAAGYKTRQEANQHWTDTAPVWVITFEVNRQQADRYMARGSQYGYTDFKSRALEPDAPAVDADTLRWITDQARTRQPVGQPRSKPPAEPGLIDRVEKALREELAGRFRGDTPDDIAAIAPHQGTPGEIRDRRRAMGLRAADGLFPVPDDQVDELVASMAAEGCTVRDVALAIDCSVGKAHKLLARLRLEEAA